jgi:hypothetical protein
MENSQDKLQRALSLLTRVKNYLREDYYGYYEYVSKICVSKYNSALSLLKDLGYDIEEFKIPSAAITYLQDIRGQWVERTLLATKLEAILSYFKIQSNPEKGNGTIGFMLPKRC